MPTITCSIGDVLELIGAPRDLAQLRRDLDLAKAEIKSVEDGRMRVELRDTNRPDLWCTEGIARQVAQHRAGRSYRYPFYTEPAAAGRSIDVDAALRDIRPYIAALSVSGLPLEEPLLEHLIEVQEVLTETYGRHRAMVSMGIYRGADLAWPVRYSGRPPAEIRFTPLAADRPMDAAEILARHPKGQEYGHLVTAHPLYPLLTDAAGRVLSLIPVINSRDLGEIRPGDSELLIEMTGTDLRAVLLTCNIMAANLADRGAEVTPVLVRYPYATEYGHEVRTPFDFTATGLLDVRVELADVSRLLGERFEADDVCRLLTCYGHEILSCDRTAIVVRAPQHRLDLLHAVDVIEDVAISRGFEAFRGRPPHDFATGGLAPETDLRDHLRASLVGLGFEEIVSYVLMSPDELTTRMGLADEGRLVHVDNVMTESMSVARDSIVPSLLRVEAQGSGAQYPHRIFEAGEVLAWSGSEPITRLVAGCLIAHPTAAFSEMHSVLELLANWYRLPVRLREAEHPSYLRGRFGRIFAGDVELGHIGEVHPAVLEAWGISRPCVAMELSVSALTAHRDLLGSRPAD